MVRYLNLRSVEVSKLVFGPIRRTRIYSGFLQLLIDDVSCHDVAYSDACRQLLYNLLDD